VEKEKIHLLKKELSSRAPKELIEICLSLAKLKVENKEMLTYLLFDAENPIAYAQRLKQDINAHFEVLNLHYYYATKSLRKVLRLIVKYSRFTKNKQGEIELLLHFGSKFIATIEKDTKHYPLLGLLLRSLNKSRLLIQKLHEDLRYDYVQEYNALLLASKKHYLNWEHQLNKPEAIDF